MQGAHRLVRGAMAVAMLTTALAGVLAATTHPAGACSCALPSDWEASAYADAVVIGTRVDRRVDGRMTIEVERVLKGTTAERQEVDEAGFMCGPDIEADQRSLLFLDRTAGRLGVQVCSPSRPVDAEAQLLAASLGGHTPVAGSVGETFGVAEGRWPLAAVVGGLVLTIVALAGIGRALARRSAFSS